MSAPDAADPRRLVCDALSVLAASGIVDYNGHASLRLPEGGFLINSGGSNRGAMTPEQVTAIGPDGAAEGPRPPNEVHLHAALYAARPDVGAVIHGHPHWSTTLTAANRPLRPVMPQASLVRGLPVYPQAHSISTPERGEAVAALMGDGNGALLRAHGLVIAAADIFEATALAIYVEQTAERQIAAEALGGAEDLPADVLDEYARTLASRALYRKAWDFWMTQARA